jgi:hypothetical protein
MNSILVRSFQAYLLTRTSTVATQFLFEDAAMHREILAAATSEPAIPSTMSVINTWVPNGYSQAAEHAWEKLSNGSSALDAVEYGCNWCETE